MRTVAVTHSAITLTIAATVLAACGGSQPPIGAPGAMPHGTMTQNRVHQLSGYSGDLLYAPVGYHLSIYSYPDLKRLEIINTFPNPLGLWADSDPNSGDMCFDNFGDVYVFKHGATQPYATISQRSGETQDCAFDPVTDDLAITYWDDNPSLHSWVSIYKPPYDGTPTEYSDAGMPFMLYDAYDASGDLFVDGQDTLGCECLYDELPKGSKTFIEFEDSQLGAGSLRWDGQYMTVTWPNVIYRFTVSGSMLTVVGKTAYEDVTRDDGFNMHGNTAMGWALHKGLQGKGRHIGFWHYPNGDEPFKVIKVFSRPKDLDWAAGIPVVSVDPSRSRIRR